MAKLSNPTEDLVQELCSKSFLADFVYRSPAYMTQSGNRREAGDLLLPLKNSLVAIQVRAREIDENFDPASHVHLGRIRRRIAHAVNQVKTAKRSLKSGALRELENLRGIRVPVRATTYDQHVGIVVIDFKTPTQSSVNLDLCIVNGLSTLKDIPVHAFLRSDFETLISELDTLPDLLNYLKTRAALIESKRLYPLTPELDLLAFFQTRYPDIKRILAGEVDHAVIEPGYWEAHQTLHKEKIDERDRRRQAGRIVDALIETVHKCIGYADPDVEGDEDLCIEAATPDSYRLIAEELASLHRAHRNEFGARILEKAEKADHDPKGFSYYAFTDLGTVFLFLASREPRKMMRRKLMNLTSAIYVRMTGLGLAKRAVGIGTQNMSARKIAQDFVYLQEGIEFDDRDLLATLANEVFGPMKEFRGDEWGSHKQQ